MLQTLYIHNFVTIEHCELNLASGLNIITGESGAGKSLLFDTISLLFGAKASSHFIRPGTSQAELAVEIDTHKLSDVTQWLDEQSLLNDESCIIRRIILKNKSKAYINGSPVSMNQLKAFGQLIINQHKQHQSLQLLHKESYRRLVDTHLATAQSLNNVEALYQQWAEIKQEIEALNQNDVSEEYLSLLRYQVEELEKLAVQPGEVDKLKLQHKQLNHSEATLTACQVLIDTLKLSDANSVEQKIYSHIKAVEELVTDKTLQDQAIEHLNEVVIHIQEATSALEQIVNKTECDGQSLQTVESRLNAVYDIAQKHKIQPEQLEDLLITLQEKLSTVGEKESKLLALTEKQSITLKNYLANSEKLHRERQSAAKKLAQQLQPICRQLGIQHAEVDIHVEQIPSQQPKPHGLDKIEFMIKTNPGAPLRPLNEIASGGELSRICLAIETITAQSLLTPILCFDEVDVGVSGATADVVGQLLKKLSQSCQILCVTHQPQVTAYAEQHLLIEKQVENNQAQSTITPLSKAQRVTEIARMLGGQNITQKTKAHAKEIIEQALDTTL